MLTWTVDSVENSQVQFKYYSELHLDGLSSFEGQVQLGFTGRHFLLREEVQMAESSGLGARSSELGARSSELGARSWEHEYTLDISASLVTPLK